VSFKSLAIKGEYRTLNDNVVQDFYIPLLSQARSYKRAVGFFSSTALVEISKGIAEMARNGGKIEIVASPYLSDEDFKAIQEGYESREKIIENALLRELPDDNEDYFSMERLNLLANLIADGILDIRIAYTDKNNKIGMYHEKMGIIEDEEGNRVVFSGSMNETLTAIAINYESIDVFCSWKDGDQGRVQKKEDAFHSIWNDVEPSLHVLRFPNVTKAFVEKYKSKKPNFGIDIEQFGDRGGGHLSDPVSPYGKPAGARQPSDVNLYDYQKEAIASWVGENYKGIFDMATGTGKTYTGLAAIAKLSEDIGDKLAVIIVAPYQHLVEQWVDDIKRFNMKPIIAYSSSPQKDWKKRLSKAIFDQEIRNDKKFFCLVCTNATFASPDVQDQINKIKEPILLVVDEAHNFGAQSYARLLDERFKYRLALSATLDRYRDEEGTALLYGFFGKKCIEYSLARAISEGKLTPYRYYPVLVYLNDTELSTYEDLSYRMSQCLFKDKLGHYKLNKYGEILALKRSRIVAGALEKLDALKEMITPYKDKNNILVYCGATRLLNESDKSFDDEDNLFDIRQIDAVTQMLGNELGMRVAKFTAEESITERISIKEHFQDGNGLQAIVAIKCLDEGVNIPGIRTAFILASTTNPKEYIQRRGRVLRKAPNKPFAEIYDFVTLPRPLDSVSGLTYEQASRDKTLVMNELRRIKEFGALAENSMVANKLVWDIEETYNITDEELDGWRDYNE